MFLFLFICVVLEVTSAVIYKLDDAQYALMPPLVRLDRYEDCQSDSNALYCTADFTLVSDQHSSLLDMIKEYSGHHATHYNHTKLRYGICVNETCKEFYSMKNLDLKLTLEACLNKTLLKEYDLKVKLDDFHCQPPGKSAKKKDYIDVFVGAITVIILLMNIAGSFCDYFFRVDQKTFAQRVLLSFSLHRNWSKLNALNPPQDPHLQNFKSLHGIRAITTALVISAHAMLNVATVIENPKLFEEVYQFKPIHIILNGTLVMQTFLIISAFLLVYNWLLSSEKHPVSWLLLPKHIAKRWLRLTLPYAFILALTSTWFAYLASGPLWNKYVAVEMSDCRKHWWRNILYINNYFNDSSCMTQCWYLATDTQLYILGVIISLACSTARSRKIALYSIFVAGMIIPAVHVYFQDLDGIQMITPENTLSLMDSDPHFNYVYKRGHTNTASYMTGMAMGYLVYRQKKGNKVKNYQKFMYRLLYWSLFPLAVLCCYSGSIFYHDAPKQSVYIRMLYAALQKPAFSLIIASIILGLIFKVEDLYRKILEWRGWLAPSRLSYSAYLIHVVVIRTYVASQTQTILHSYFSMAINSFKILSVTFTAALVFWLLVEAPFSNIMKQSFGYERRTMENKMKKN